MRRALVLVGLVGCRQLLDIPGHGQLIGKEGYGLHAVVKGARGASLGALIQINQTPEPVSDSEDFVFQTRFPDGVHYTVEAAHADCVVSNGTGTISGGDASGIEINCDGLAALGTFGFSAPLEFDPAFDPAVSTMTSYRSLLIQQTSLAPQPLYDAQLTSVGFGSMTVPPPYGPFALSSTDQFVVDLAGRGFSRKYTATTTTVAPAAFGYGKPTAPVAGEGFGAAVAAEGDLLVVGAPNQGAGRAIVYRRTESTWTEEAVLTPSPPQAGEHFGASVAVHGARIVIGAPVTGSRGRAFLFESMTTGWQQTQSIPAPIASDDAFGASVALNTTALFVGAPSDTCGTGGCVYRFGFDGMMQTLTPPSLSAGDRFGASLAATDSALLVGAPGDDSSGNATDPPYPDSGAAYAYDLGNTLPPVLIKAAVPGADDQFGTAVALDARYAIIGAPLEDSADPTDPTNNDASAAGAAYLFATGTWNQLQWVKASTPHVGDNLGRAVAISGNAVGVADEVVAVGAPYDNSGGLAAGDQSAPDAGAVYAYKVQGPVLVDETYIKAKHIGAGDAFGGSLSLTPESLIAGAPLDDSDSSGWNGPANEGLLDAGAVYTFR